LLISIKKKLRKKLKERSEGIYFDSNTKYAIAPNLLMLASVMLLSLNNTMFFGVNIFMSIWMGFWSVTLARFILSHINSFSQQAVSDRIKGLSPIVSILFFVLSGALFYLVTIGLVELILFLVFAMYGGIFSYIMNVPTEKGMEIIRTMKGLKKYLEYLNQGRFNSWRDLNQTDFMDFYLPWLIALDMENHIYRKLEGFVTGGNGFYSPRWYRGHTVGKLSCSRMVADISSRISMSVSPKSRGWVFIGGGW